MIKNIRKERKNLSKIRRNRRRRKVKSISSFFIVAFCIAIVSIMIKPTLARYSSSGTSNANLDIAFYLLQEETLSEEIILEDVMPGNNVYTYYFSVANNDGVRRTDVDLEYDIEVKMTTNLPLTYSLYVNDGTEDLFRNYETEVDDDGMYYKRIISQENVFTFEEDQENIYRLEIRFPAEYNSIIYQGIAEALDIIINSRQII